MKKKPKRKRVNGMIKRILINLIFAELLYLLIKPLIVKLESKDDIDTAPADYALNGDQVDLNGVGK